MRNFGVTNLAIGKKEPLTARAVLELLEHKIAHLNIRAALDDILVFVRDQRKIEIWSKEFFMHLLDQLQFD